MVGPSRAMANTVERAACGSVCWPAKVNHTAIARWHHKEKRKEMQLEKDSTAGTVRHEPNTSPAAASSHPPAMAVPASGISGHGHQRSSHSIHIKSVPTAVWQRARQNAIASGLAFRHYIISLLTSCQPLTVESDLGSEDRLPENGARVGHETPDTT